MRFQRGLAVAVFITSTQLMGCLFDYSIPTDGSGGGTAGLTISGSFTVPTSGDESALTTLVLPGSNYHDTSVNGTCSLLNSGFEVLDTSLTSEGTYTFENVDPDDLVDTTQDTTGLRAAFYVRCEDAAGVVQMATIETSLDTLTGASASALALGGSLSASTLTIPVSIHSTAATLLTFGSSLMNGGISPLTATAEQPAAVVPYFSGKAAAMASVVEMVQDTSPTGTTSDSRISLMLQGMIAVQAIAESHLGTLSGGTSGTYALGLLTTGSVEIGPEPMVSAIGPEPMIEILEAIGSNAIISSALSAPEDIADLVDDTTSFSVSMGSLVSKDSFITALDDSDVIDLSMAGLVAERSLDDLDDIISAPGTVEAMMGMAQKGAASDLAKSDLKDIMVSLAKKDTLVAIGESADNSEKNLMFQSFVDHVLIADNPKDKASLLGAVLALNINDSTFLNRFKTTTNDDAITGLFTYISDQGETLNANNLVSSYVNHEVNNGGSEDSK